MRDAVTWSHGGWTCNDVIILWWLRFDPNSWRVCTHWFVSHRPSRSVRVDLKKKIKTQKKRERRSINSSLLPSFGVSQRSFQHLHSTKYSVFFPLSRFQMEDCLRSAYKWFSKKKAALHWWSLEMWKPRIHPSLSRHALFPTSCFGVCFASVSKTFQHFNNCQAVNNGYARKYLPPVRGLNSSEIALNPSTHKPVLGGGTARIRSTVLKGISIGGCVGGGNHRDKSNLLS